MTKNHPRVAQGAASDSETDRYQKLLDAEILPRLERPGRYLGPFEARGIATESAEITRLALLWPSVPESHQTPAGLAPLKLALESRSQLPLELVCVPAPDATELLVERGLPVFSRPSWIPLASFERLLLWIEQPAQLLGLLSLLGLGGLARRSADRVGGPELIAAGPAAEKMPELLAIWCDRVVKEADPRELAKQILEDPPARAVAPGEATIPQPQLARAREEEFLRVPDLPGHEERVRPCFEGAPTHAPVESSRGFGGVKTTRIRLGAASERLRAERSLLDSGQLREQVAEALAHESGQIEIELSLGIPGESPEDRAAIPLLADQLCRIAPRGARQIRILLSTQLPAESAGAVGPAELSRSLDEIRGRISERKLRFQTLSPAEFLVSTALLQRGPGLAESIERAHAGGAWHGDVDASFDPSRWPEIATRPAEDDAGALALSTRAEASPTGLESLAPIPPTLDHNGHPLRSEEPVSGTGDRWRRWSALVPREHQLRLVFEKRGVLRLLSHREMVELLLEACRRAGLPLSVSGVVAPRPKTSFGPSLPIGVEGHEEFVDLSLDRKVAGAVSALNEHLPDGLLVRRARYMPPGARCAHAPVHRARYLARIPSIQRDALAKGLDEFADRVSWPIDRQKAGESAGIDLKSQVIRVHTDEDTKGATQLRFECDLSVEGVKLRPNEFVAALLDRPVEEVSTLTLCREQLLSRGGEPMGAWRTPLELVELAMQRSRLMVKRYS